MTATTAPILITGVCYGTRWYPCPAWLLEAHLKGTELTLLCNGPALRAAHKYVSAGSAWYSYHGRYFQACRMGEGGGRVTITAREQSAEDARLAGVA